MGPPPPARWRWMAHRPAGIARPAPPGPRSAYTGPPRYRGVPRWGFPPSVWVSTDRPAPAADPVSPARDLRSVVILARATAVVCLLAALAETFRFVLLVRGRTEVLPAAQVRWSDALVVAAGWAAPMLAVATAAAVLPAIARTGAWAVRRAGLRPARSTTRRLVWLLVPGWNLYGAGAVVAEIDAMLRLPPPERPVPPRPDRLRWRSSRLPAVDVPSPTEPAAAAATEEPPVTDPEPVHRSPRRIAVWWWATWALSGLLTAVALIWSLDPGSLQARANLVELHVLIDLVAAACAMLTAAVARSWHRIVAPEPVGWPAGWVLSAPRRDELADTRRS